MACDKRESSAHEKHRKQTPAPIRHLGPPLRAGTQSGQDWASPLPRRSRFAWMDGRIGQWLIHAPPCPRALRCPQAAEVASSRRVGRVRAKFVVVLWGRHLRAVLVVFLPSEQHGFADTLSTAPDGTQTAPPVRAAFVDGARRPKTAAPTRGLSGAPGRIRTCDPSLRRRPL
jgi:hypothetical protein